MGGYSFFAGANSENGFVSYYSSFDSDMENTAVYNIIGGPGTGKSSLMKKLSALSDKYGWECEKYFCSSDPNSLDAIRLLSKTDNRKIVVCDATAPHPRELSTPGAASRIVDLSAFWNCEKLMVQKNRIIELQQLKKEAYREAYIHLNIAGKILKQTFDVRKRQFNTPKLRELLGNLNITKQGECTLKRPVRCISMFGEKTLDNNGFGANNVIYVKDQIDCAIILSFILQYTNASLASPHPVVNDLLDEAYFQESDLCITCIAQNAGKRLNLKDLISESFSEEYIMLKEAYHKFKDLSIRSLSCAKESHFALEEIYGDAMDFSLKEEYDERVVKNVSLLME